MEIKVGDYVRTKKGLIAKVCAHQDLTIYEDKGISVTFHSFDTDKGTIADIDIARHSEDIIDLIEVGDIVNGERILDIIGDYIHSSGADYSKVYLSIHIKSILTHEQYENNAYKVEE